MLTIHAFSDHKHGVCTSKVENHVHEKEVDCKLDITKLNDTLLASESYENIVTTTITDKHSNGYNFLKNHLNLSFSLRGPPSYNFI
tara:strand:+ start:1171 stop:1428 length:258 start_codon:yes stop_codon:yes gene_type:complete